MHESEDMKNQKTVIFNRDFNDELIGICGGEASPKYIVIDPEDDLHKKLVSRFATQVGPVVAPGRSLPGISLNKPKTFDSQIPLVAKYEDGVATASVSQKLDSGIIVSTDRPFFIVEEYTKSNKDKPLRELAQRLESTRQTNRLYLMVLDADSSHGMAGHMNLQMKNILGYVNSLFDYTDDGEPYQQKKDGYSINPVTYDCKLNGVPSSIVTFWAKGKKGEQGRVNYGLEPGLVKELFPGKKPSRAAGNSFGRGNSQRGSAGMGLG